MKAIRDAARKLAMEGRRTATVTRLRMELSSLDRKRRELLARLGEHVNDLRQNGQIADAGLLGLLQADFDDIDRINREIHQTLESIQSVSLTGAEPEERAPAASEQKPSESLLDSFEVL